MRHSWWPGPNEIDSLQCGVYGWYWSEKNEMDYLERKAELESEKPVPLSAGVWKVKMRGNNKCRGLLKTYKENARLWVDARLNNGDGR